MSREEFIKDQVKQMDMSLKSFSEMIHMPYTTFISILNNGIAGAALDNVIKICEGLGITIEVLQTNERLSEIKVLPLIDTKHLKGIESSLITLYRQVDETRKDKLIEYAELLNDRSGDELADKEKHATYHSSGFGVIGEERNPEYTHKYNSLDKEARARIKNVLDFEYEKLLEKREQERVTLIAPSMPVCAGYGNYLDDNMEYETIEVVKNKYTYGATHVIKLQGDSMEPEFHDGDKLIITETKGETPINGRVGIFIVNGCAYLRQLLDGTLHPYNPSYKDTTPNEYDNIKYVGYVVGILDDSWVVG